jgi:chemotaxis protein histidine kinase CheA
MDITEFLNEFQLEAGEKLDLIASQLLQLERDSSNPQPVREMFLAAHTIKGGAAMLRLTCVEALAHALEDLLSKIRDQQRAVDAATADVLFQAIDRLRALIGEASAESVGAEPDAELAEFVSQLHTGSVTVAPKRGPRRALVIEVSPTVRELERMLAEDAGYEVEARSEPGESLADFAVIVASLSDGLGLCRSMNGPAVVLTTTDPDAALAEKATAAGAKALVRKGSLGDPELTRVLRELN